MLVNFSTWASGAEELVLVVGERLGQSAEVLQRLVELHALTAEVSGGRVEQPGQRTDAAGVGLLAPSGPSAMSGR